MMESILSISSENVVFQESDNLFIDNLIHSNTLLLMGRRLIFGWIRQLWQEHFQDNCRDMIDFRSFGNIQHLNYFPQLFEE